MTGLDPVIFVHTQEDGRVKHGQDEKGSQKLPFGPFSSSQAQEPQQAS
jgi:hypothetical protein